MKGYMDKKLIMGNLNGPHAKPAFKDNNVRTCGFFWLTQSRTCLVFAQLNSPHPSTN